MLKGEKLRMRWTDDCGAQALTGETATFASEGVQAGRVRGTPAFEVFYDWGLN